MSNHGPAPDENHEMADRDEIEVGVGRRTALRRGGALLAGVAGLSAAGAAGASSASAAPGDPVVQGAVNNAASSQTTLTSTSVSNTLVLANTADGAPLNVAPQEPAAVFAFAGTMGAHQSADFGEFAFPTFTHVSGTSEVDPALKSLVFTEAWALQPIPITPQRVLDTRTAAGRVWVLDPAGKFDAAGRLLGGRTITLTLAEYVFAPGGVFGNLTVTGPLASGHLTLYTVDPRPGTSSINFVANQTIANFSFTGLNFTGTDVTVKIYARSTTHVIFDVTGFAVGSDFFIFPGFRQAVAPTALAKAVDMSAAPAWFREQQARKASPVSRG
jgi:hypothetical protein